MKLMKLFFFGLLTMTAALIARETEPAFFSLKEIETLISIGDFSFDPSGQQIAASITSPQWEEEKPIQTAKISLIDLKTKTKHPLTQGKGKDVSPVWSPTGEWIAFLSTREGGKNLFLIAPNGGEAIQITNSKAPITAFDFSPDGKTIAFTMGEKVETDTPYETVDAPKEISHLWLIEAKPELQEPKKLTSGEYPVRAGGDFGRSYREFDFSPDGSEIAFGSTQGIYLNDFHKEARLVILNLETLSEKPLEQIKPVEVMPRYSPDGKHLAFIESDEEALLTFSRYLSLIHLETGERRRLPNTYNEGPFLPCNFLAGWTEDSQALVFQEPYRTRNLVFVYPIYGEEPKDITPENLTTSSVVIPRNGTFLGIIGETLNTPAELYIRNKSGEFCQVTDLNPSKKELPAIRSEVVTWPSYDGEMIEGILIYPLYYEEGKKYPLLLNPHGGPMGFYDENYQARLNVYPLAAFAEAGYFILKPNFRGSCGYGKDFRCANTNDWGGKDYEDNLSGVDALIEKGVVDENRLGVMGWSYGGYMAAWMVSQTSRFQAASLGGGLYNLVSATGTTDMFSLVEDFFSGDIASRWELMMERSPLIYVNEIATPLLIQHGAKDLRAPFSQSMELFRALKKLGKDVEFHLYPDMPHAPATLEQIDTVMKENLSFFKKMIPPGPLDL